MEIKQSKFACLKSLFLLIVLFALTGVLLQWKLLSWFQTFHIKPLTDHMFLTEERITKVVRWEMENLVQVEERCAPESPELYNKDVLPFLAKETPVNCRVKTPKSEKIYDGVLFTMKDGRYLKRLKDVGASCCMKQIKRNEEDDGIWNTTAGQCFPITRALTKIKKTVNYVFVECKEENTSTMIYTEAFAVIHKKESPEQSDTSAKLNVILIGMESTSQLNFMRKMPLTHNYLRQRKSAVLLKGHNKVGECTHANIIPMIAGQSTPDFKRDCSEPQKQKNIPVKLDNCSLMWNKFSEKGYVTLFGEDYAKWGPFDYYWPKTFKKSPTDYYLRPLAVFAEGLGDYYATDFSCLGPRLGFEVILETVKTVAEVNKDQPFFQLVWPCSLGYKDLNHQQRGDKLLLSTLEHFEKTNVLNNTVIFLVGDHGFRKMGYRYTHFGAVEDRMPVAYILLPEWFQKSYPEYFSNLKINSKIMTSHFDIYKTMIEILHLGDMHNEENNEPGISLFKPISTERNCLAAGIPLFWCLPCHSRQPVEEEIQVEVATFLIKMFNSGHQLCDPFVFNLRNYTLKAILFASKWNPKDVQRELCNADGNAVTLPGFYGQPAASINVPCSTFYEAEDRVEIVMVEFATEATNSTFTGEVIRYQTRTGGRWHYQLTEDIQFNYIDR